MSTDGTGGRAAGPGWDRAGQGRAGPEAPPFSLSDLIEAFRAQLRDDPDVASAVAAIRALLGFLKRDRGGHRASPPPPLGARHQPPGPALTALLSLPSPHTPGETIQGLRSSLLDAIETLSRVDSSVAVSSGGELFLRFISLTSLEYSVRAAASRSATLLAPRPSGLAADASPSLPGLLQMQRNHDRARGDFPEEGLAVEEQNRQALSSVHQRRCCK